jgi:hypothetical protein
MSDRLQHKLAHYEVKPPAATWSAIVDALEDQSSALAGRLQNLEMSPPAHLWQQIEGELDAEIKTPSPNISLYRRLAKPLRYGAAVAILALVAISVTLLLNKNSVSSELAQQPAMNRPVESEAAPTIESKTETVRSQSQLAQPIENKESSAKTERPALSAENADIEKPTQQPVDHRYLTVATETGTPVRLSKKVYAVFDCAEHSTTLQRHQCKKNIESLQKMASSLASPSGDFASLMDMIKTLEENR